MFRRVTVCIISFLLFLISAVALAKPKDTNYKYEITDPDDRIVAVLTAEDIDELHDCYIDGEGRIVSPGSWDYPYVRFSELDLSFSGAVIRLGENESGVSLLLNDEDGEGFTEDNTVNMYVQPGETAAVFPSHTDLSTAVRFGSSDPLTFEALELHSSAPELIKVKFPMSPLRILCCFVFAVAASVIILLADIRFGFTDRIVNAVRNNSKKLSAVAAGAALSAVSAVLIEFIIYFVRNRSGGEAFFNIYEAVLIFGVLNVLTVIAVFIKDIGEKPENAFLCVTLTLCMLLIFVCPFGHVCWDDRIHYRLALNASNIGSATYYTEADRKVFIVADDFKVSGGYADNAERTEKMNASYDSILSVRDGSTTVAHLADGYILALCRLAGISFSKSVTLAKFGSALIYCLVCYFAMRRLKSGKMILAAVSMIPTSLFIASNFSYDYWVTCFVILGMAYFVGNLQEKDEAISVGDTVIMCAAFALSALPKLPYALMLIIPFFMKPKKIKNKKQYYAICCFAFVLLAAMLVIKSFAQIDNGGDTRGGEDVNATGQIQFIMANPVDTVKMLVKFVWDYLSYKNVFRYTVEYAFTGTGRGSRVMIALMLLTAFTDKNEYDKGASNLLIRSMGIAEYIGMSFVLALAMYIIFTPVGYETVEGCQFRYIIPLLYPFLSVIGWGGFKNRIPAAVYNSAVIALMAALNIYNIWLVLFPFVS